MTKGAADSKRWATRRVSIGLIGIRGASELDPDNRIIHNSLGVALLNIGQPAETQAKFQKAVEADLTHAQAHENLRLDLPL